MIKAKHEINRVIQNQRKVIRKIETKAEKFLDAAARIGVNASKDPSRPGTWRDRTGNLRSSISQFLRESSGRQEAVVFAGMDYAIFVHFRDGFQVLVPPPDAQVEGIKRMLRL